MTKPRQMGDKAKAVVRLILDDVLKNDASAYEALEALALDKDADAVKAIRDLRMVNRRIEMVCWALLRGDMDEAMARANEGRPPKPE
jgi:hypothetical protein